ncbi:hypothetical protein Tco_0424707 [Tanacetum coccineum]
MAISFISVSSNSSEDSMGTPAGQVILFGTIPTTILDTTPVITPTITQTNTTVIPIIAANIPPLPAISPFLSSADDTTDSDTPDTPPLPTHGTPFTETTLSTQRSPTASGALPHRDMVLAPGQPIPHETSLDSPADALYDSASSHSSFDHSLPASPSGTRSSHRLFSLVLSVHHSSDISKRPSHDSSSASRSRKRIDRHCIILLDDGCVISNGIEINPEIQAEINECFAYADALRDGGIDARVLVEVVDQEESETGTRGPTEVRVKRVTHPVMPEDTPKPAQEGAVEVTYETLGDLVQRFHDHTEAIPVHHIQAIKGVQRESGRRIVGSESAVTILTKRVDELERDNRRGGWGGGLRTFASGGESEI